MVVGWDNSNIRTNIIITHIKINFVDLMVLNVEGALSPIINFDVDFNGVNW